MKKLTLLLSLCILVLNVFAQKHNADSAVKVMQAQEDSTLRAAMHADSVRIKENLHLK